MARTSPDPTPDDHRTVDPDALVSIRRGDRGDVVNAMQVAICRAWPTMRDEFLEAGEVGEYGELTVRGVAALQRLVELPVNGDQVDDCEQLWALVHEAIPELLPIDDPPPEPTA